MKHYLPRIFVMLALAGLTTACNPLWEAPPLQRLLARPTATAVENPVGEPTMR